MASDRKTRIAKDVISGLTQRHSQVHRIYGPVNWKLLDDLEKYDRLNVNYLPLAIRDDVREESEKLLGRTYATLESEGILRRKLPYWAVVHESLGIATMNPDNGNCFFASYPYANDYALAVHSAKKQDIRIFKVMDEGRVRKMC